MGEDAAEGSRRDGQAPGTPPFESVRGSLPLPVVLSCEHAADSVPEELGDLGMTAEQRAACHGHDPGAAEVFDELVRAMDVHGIKARVSRLVIDLNRYLSQPDVITKRCGGRDIPANMELSEERFRQRVERYYRPYHEELSRLLLDCERRHGTAYFFLIHTMAEEFEGQVREQDFTLVCNGGRDVAEQLRETLEGRGFTVTVNDPFGLDHDLVRCDRGSPLERFNERAVLVEVNERRAGEREAREALAAALRQAVEAS